MILIIDNYDSFTYNIYQYVRENNHEVEIVKNDNVDFNKINNNKYTHIIISPGPGAPNSAGQSHLVIREFYKKIPILGVCLGHQVIGEFFGGKIINHNEVCHGKVSEIHHINNSILYKNIPKIFNATRYHSLVINKKTLSKELIITAELIDNTIMGIQHKKYALHGVQFHPESIETKCGKQIIKNFIEIV